MRKKIVVIGGSGFVGTNLCQLLENNGAEFEIIDIKPSKSFPDRYKYGDVRDVKSLRRAVTGQVLVNLAAVHRDDITDNSSYWNTNVEGAKNINAICIEKGIKRIVFTSSVAVYGNAPAGTDENGHVNPTNIYGRTKFEAEEIFRCWRSEHGGALTIIRPTVIFGAGNRGNVFNLFRQIASRKFIMIGSGKNKKSMAYIENVAEFLMKCIENEERYAVYNYVDAPDLDMDTLVQKVNVGLGYKKSHRLRIPYFLAILIGYTFDAFSKITKKPLPISSNRIKKFCSTSSFSSRSSELNGFKASYTIEEGILLTLKNE